MLLRGVSGKGLNLILHRRDTCISFKGMERLVSSKWPKLMLMSAATAAWLIYDMAAATEAPRVAVAYMQYAFLALAVIGFFGAWLNYASEK